MRKISPSNPEDDAPPAKHVSGQSNHQTRRIDYLRDQSRVLYAHFNKLEPREKAIVAALCMGKSLDDVGAAPGDAWLGLLALLLGSLRRNIVRTKMHYTGGRGNKSGHGVRLRHIAGKIATLESVMCIPFANPEISEWLPALKPDDIEKLRKELVASARILTAFAPKKLPLRTKPTKRHRIKSHSRCLLSLTAPPDGDYCELHEDIAGIDRRITGNVDSPE